MAIPTPQDKIYCARYDKWSSVLGVCSACQREQAMTAPKREGEQNADRQEPLGKSPVAEKSATPQDDPRGSTVRDVPAVSAPVAAEDIVERLRKRPWLGNTPYPILDEAAATIEKLRGELAELRKDAERYRRLRENWIHCDELCLYGRLSAIDAGIDAAMTGRQTP